MGVSTLKLNVFYDFKVFILGLQSTHALLFSFQISTKRMIYSSYSWCRGADMIYGPIHRTPVILQFSLIPKPPCFH